MVKTSFWRDEILGELLELGKSTGKKSVQQIGQTFSPLKIFEGVVNNSNSNTASSLEKKEKDQAKKQNNTPLNFEKLQEKYQSQDKQKEEFLRQRFFQLIKRAEEETLQREKQKEAEKQRIETYQEQERKLKEEERKKQEALFDMPRGKIRRSIFSHKKVAQRQQVEVKPATGKQ